MNRLEFAKQSINKPPQNDISLDVIIHETAIIGLDGFGWVRDSDNTLVKMNHSGSVKIANGVEIKAFVTVDRAVNEGQFTEIGEGTKIDHHCHIAHNAKIGKFNTIADGCIIEGSCILGDFNTFGAGVIVQRKTNIGNNCTIGSGSVITKNIPDNAVVVGNNRILRFKE